MTNSSEKTDSTGLPWFRGVTWIQVEVEGDVNQQQPLWNFRLLADNGLSMSHCSDMGS